jgi:hypothetical protein
MVCYLSLWSLKGVLVDSRDPEGVFDPSILLIPRHHSLGTSTAQGETSAAIPFSLSKLTHNHSVLALDQLDLPIL